MAAAATKFSESQLEALEKAYNEGLKSCKLGVNGQKIETLALECNLPRGKVTTWINNCNRRARREATKNRERELPDDSSAEGTDLSADGNDGGSQQFKKAPIHRRLSAWNVFCSKVLREGRHLFFKFRPSPKWCQNSHFQLLQPAALVVLAIQWVLYA